MHLKSCTPCAKWHRSPILHLCVNVYSGHSSNLCAPTAAQVLCNVTLSDQKQHSLVEQLDPVKGKFLSDPKQVW